MLMASWGQFSLSGGTKAQVFHSYQVVGRSVKVKLPANLLNTAVHGLTYSADGLHPTKAFFDPFSDSLADGIVRMIGCPTINGRLPVGVVLGNMRRDLEIAKFLDEFGGVVAFVAAQGNTPGRPGQFFYHCLCRFALAGTGCCGYLGLDDQAATILHQGVSLVAELRFLGLAFAVEAGIRMVTDAWVSFLSFLPLKSTVSFLPPPTDGGPSLGLKLLMEAHASIKVPSTVKCSRDSRCFRAAWARIRERNSAATSEPISRS